jgi:hypothetical protein
MVGKARRVYPATLLWQLTGRSAIIYPFIPIKLETLENLHRLKLRSSEIIS